MAFNPGKEVAAVRDAANKLDSPFAVMIFLDKDGETISMASYGKNVALCEKAGKFGDYLLEAALNWGKEDVAKA